MKIVIDTNVFISAVFFECIPLKILQTIISKKHEAYVSPEIWDEYRDVISRMTKKYPSRLKQNLIDELFKLFKGRTIKFLISNKCDKGILSINTAQNALFFKSQLSGFKLTCKLYLPYFSQGISVGKNSQRLAP